MHKARLQRNGEALAFAAELRTFGLAVVTYPNLTEVFHIMHIQPHHVSQPMRIEQGMCTLTNSIFRITLHQAELFHPLHHNAGRKFVNTHIRDARTERLDRLQMHSILNFINGTLAGSECLIGRNRRRHITGIARFHFRTGVNQEQVSRFHFISMIMIMQGLTVDRSNRGK